jgi:hypothetical protein
MDTPQAAAQELPSVLEHGEKSSDWYVDGARGGEGHEHGAACNGADDVCDEHGKGDSEIVQGSFEAWQVRKPLADAVPVSGVAPSLLTVTLEQKCSAWFSLGLRTCFSAF